MILDILVDSLIDNLKLLPFLFLTFLLMEYIEDRMKDSARNKMINAKKYGPIIGGLLGAVPQCGFSAAASNLYAGRVISMGTLIAVFLSTSDEMLPIMISERVGILFIIKILAIKVVYGIAIGFVIDLIYGRISHQTKQEIDIHHFCEHEHCECGHGIVKPAIKHTLKIFAFLLIISFVIGIIVEYVGLEAIKGTVISNVVVGPVIFGLIGLIPNCAASVFITSVYLEGAVSLGTLMSGLFVGAGVGILVLARVNENKKETFSIIGLLYLTGIIGGILLNILIG